jgi:hypothetical protein
MTNELIQIKFRQRLNKLSSQDYDNLQCWGIVEAFNNAQLKFVRRQIIGINTKQVGDEGTKNLIDDIQVLLKRVDLNPSVTNARYVETVVLPADYLYLKKVEVTASKGSCTNRIMTSYLVEEADVNNVEADHNSEPSFEWGETFYTIAGNKLRIYKNDFTITKINLTYYRRPLDIKIQGCVDPSTGQVSAQNVLCEFKDDVTEVIIDEAISITAADIESFNQYSVAKQNVQTNG